MKTQYYNIISVNDTLYTLKGAGIGTAICVVDLSVVRKNHKGHMSLDAVKAARKPFHKGIMKIADAGVTFLSY